MKKLIGFTLLFFGFYVQGFAQCEDYGISSPTTETICEEDAVQVYLVNSNSAEEYQLYFDGNPTGAPLMGTDGILLLTSDAITSSGTLSVYNITCSSTWSTTISVTVNPLPTGSLTTGTTPICAGDGTSFTVNLPPGQFDVTYSSTLGSVNLYSISDGLIENVSPTISAIYDITSITNTSTGCTVTSPHANIGSGAAFAVNALPGGTLSLDLYSICAGGSTNLNFSLGAGTYDLQYTDGLSTLNLNSVSGFVPISVNPNETTTYDWVSLTDLSTGCIATAPDPYLTGASELTVGGGGMVPTIGGPTDVCVSGESTETYNTDEGFTNYVWTIDGGTINFDGGSYVQVHWETPGAGSVSVIYDDNGCPSQSNILNVTINAIPTPSITGPSTVCPGGVSSFYSTEAGQSIYSWSITSGDGSIVGSSTSDVVEVQWLTAGTLTVSYVTPSGCSAELPSEINVSISNLNFGINTSPFLCGDGTPYNRPERLTKPPARSS